MIHGGTSADVSRLFFLKGREDRTLFLLPGLPAEGKFVTYGKMAVPMAVTVTTGMNTYFL